ncbi:MAG: hypothetical protein CME70_16380 [Halobacteriovorax sp.]|nr:hypothetical protein [Halobacteriovorax sp.]|tara:strand:- start:14646 stop:14870 length:225 start_codon:yes stop_codon:yes gene_type:complete
MLDKIQTAFSEVFGVDSSLVNTDTTINNLKEWDSLKHLQMIMKLEANFSTKFEMGEIAQMDSVQKIIEVLESKA